MPRYGSGPTPYNPPKPQPYTPGLGGQSAQTPGGYPNGFRPPGGNPWPPAPVPAPMQPLGMQTQYSHSSAGAPVQQAPKQQQQQSLAVMFPHLFPPGMAL